MIHVVITKNSDGSYVVIRDGGPVSFLPRMPDAEAKNETDLKTTLQIMDVPEEKIVEAIRQLRSQERTRFSYEPLRHPNEPIT